MAAMKFHPEAQVPGCIPAGREPKPPDRAPTRCDLGLVKPGIAAARLEMVNGR